MPNCKLDTVTQTRDIVKLVEKSSEPVIVFDGDEECLIAMSPATFERILFDSDLLNCENRDSLHL